MGCKKVFLLVATLSSMVLAQIPNIGFCPEYIPMNDFDMDRFLGKWYEAERYFTVSEVASRCVTTEYSKAPSGKHYVSNEITNRLTGIKRVIEGSLDLNGKVGEGKMTVHYTSFPPYDTSYIVLDTDYKTYAVIWSCSGIGPVHTQNAWVMTRERNPPTSALQRAYGILDKYKISRTFFLKTDQKDCLLGGDVPVATASAEEQPEAQPAAKSAEPAPVLPVAEHILKQTQQERIHQHEEKKDNSPIVPPPEA